MCCYLIGGLPLAWAWLLAGRAGLGRGGGAVLDPEAVDVATQELDLAGVDDGQVAGGLVDLAQVVQDDVILPAWQVAQRAGVRVHGGVHMPHRDVFDDVGQRQAGVVTHQAPEAVHVARYALLLRASRGQHQWGWGRRSRGARGHRQDVIGLHAGGYRLARHGHDHVAAGLTLLVTECAGRWRWGGQQAWLAHSETVVHRLRRRERRGTRHGGDR